MIKYVKNKNYVTELSVTEIGFRILFLFKAFIIFFPSMYNLY